MKKVVAIVVVALIVIGGIVVYAYKDKLYGNSSGSTTTQNSSSSAPSATNTVTIDNFAFSPSAITVKKGTTVTWTNKDSATHTVTETDGKEGPKSGSLETGKSYSFTFTTAGTFQYDCSIHTNMVGTVTVTE